MNEQIKNEQINQNVEKNKGKNRRSHYEIFILFKFFKPAELVKLGYSKATVYKYNKDWKEAKQKAIEFLQKTKFKDFKKEDIEKMIS